MPTDIRREKKGYLVVSIHQQERVSILLIKPDGVSDPKKAQDIARCIDESELKVIDCSEVTLTRDAVDDIWPKFVSSAHAFTRRMLALYVTSGPCRVLVVEADDVITVCRGIRSGVRHRFGDAVFENALHTPADAVERASNVAFFVTDRTFFVRHHDPIAGLGRYGRLGNLSEEEAQTLAEQMWDEKVRGGWESMRSSTDLVQPGLILLPGSDNSVDFEISAIAEVFPYRSLAWCARRFLEAEKFGASPIALAQGEAKKAVSALDSLGVRVATTVRSG